VRSIKEAAAAVVVAATTAVKLLHYREACSALVVKQHCWITNQELELCCSHANSSAVLIRRDATVKYAQPL
jgi:hypothetical protein